MFPWMMLVAASVIFPAGGSYTYEISTDAGAHFTTTVIVAPQADGVDTAERFGTPSPTAWTDQEFDADLHPVLWTGSKRGDPDVLTIALTALSADYQIGTTTASLGLDDPACYLVQDNVLTFSVMLPAVIRATGASECTLIVSTGVASMVATISTIPPRPRPERAAADDSSVTITFGKIVETVWYDPRSLIPDYLDYGNADAILRASSTSTTIPATPTPMPSPQASAAPGG